jgi:hypothetical protein
VDATLEVPGHLTGGWEVLMKSRPVILKESARAPSELSGLQATRDVQFFVVISSIASKGDRGSLKKRGHCGPKIRFCSTPKQQGPCPAETKPARPRLCSKRLSFFYFNAAPSCGVDRSGLM